MDLVGDITVALTRPLRALVDPNERIFWLFALSSLVMPWLVLGLRRGTREIAGGLLARALWRQASARADITLVFVKALLFGLLKVPWAAATIGATLWVGLTLHDTFGPAPASGWSPLAVGVAYTVVLFVAWDFSRFVLHLAMHRLPTLWAFHQVHHSATVLTPLTLYRTHPVETLLYDARGLVSTALVSGLFLYLFPSDATAIELLGINAIGFAFNLAGANLRHSHVWLSFGRLESWLLSPSQHQLHHARDDERAASGRRHDETNFGTWLALWDRLVGTWQRSPATPPQRYGLERPNHDPGSVASMLIGPLADLWRRRKARARPATIAVVALAGTALPRHAAAAPPAPPASAGDDDASAPDAGDDDDIPTEAAPPASAGDDDGDDDDDDDVVREVRVGSLFQDEEVPRIAGSAHVVSEKDLERNEYDDVHRVLETVPGVYVRGEDGFGLRPNIGLRGANPDRSAKITLLEDGILQGPAPYSAPAAYYFPLATRMVGMEVFKGPAAIRYGPNTIGGAINFLTREIPDDHLSVVDMAAGRFGYIKGHGFYGTTYKGFGVLVEAAHVQTSGFKDLDTAGDTGFAKTDTMLKLGYETPAGRRTQHDIELKGGLALEDSHETYLGLTQADFEATPYRRYAASDLDRMRWWRTQGELSYVLRQEETIELDVRAYRHDFDRTWRRLDSFAGGPSITDILADPDAGQAAVFAAILRGEQDTVLPQQALLLTNNNRTFVSQGLQSTFHWRPKWRIVSQELEVGARLHNDWIERHHTGDSFAMTSGRLARDDTPRSDVVLNRGEAVAAAFHVQDAITLWDRFTLAPGVRVEVISMRFRDELVDLENRRLDTPLLPGLGAHVQATKWLGVFAGVHRGFSPVAPGQPDEVEPEFAINYEAGARAYYEGLHAEAVGFVSDYDNLIGACTFSSGCVMGDGNDQFNAGRVLVYGLESLARYRHWFDIGLGLELGANYTYTATRFRDEFTSSFPQWGVVVAGDELPYVPKHVLGGTFGIGGRIWDIHLSPAFTSEMRDIAGSGPIPPGERIPGFFVLDAGAEVRVLQRLRLYTQFGNLTNNAYNAGRRPFGIRPGAPLTFMFGVKAHLWG